MPPPTRCIDKTVFDIFVKSLVDSPPDRDLYTSTDGDAACAADAGTVLLSYGDPPPDLKSGRERCSRQGANPRRHRKMQLFDN